MNKTLSNTLNYKLGLTAGALLSLMIFINGELARQTSAFKSSLIVHFIGSVSALLLWYLFSSKKSKLYSRDIPIYLYLGGIAGAVIVLLANITITSNLGLAGSLSLMILGQVIFALIVDTTGLFGAAKKSIQVQDFLQLLLILVGSLFIIFSEVA